MTELATINGGSPAPSGQRSSALAIGAEQSGNIPEGYCQCGCGQRTAISKRNFPSRGWVKGRPLRYITRHHVRRSGPEYAEQDRGHDTPCWIWQRYTAPDGYGKKKSQVGSTLAHRIYYEQAYGPVPEGLCLDHLCRVRNCVNPAHLEVVTAGENTRRGEGLAVINAQKTHCPSGHEYSYANTRVIKGGYRRCIQCAQEAQRRYDARRRTHVAIGGVR